MLIDAITPDDIIDSRDLIEALEDYEQRDDEDQAEYADIAAGIRALIEVGVEDWEYGVALIRDDYFTAFAQDFAEEIGRMPTGEPSWPTYCIDWERAAKDLQMDYTPVEFLGYTYWVR